jgi:hypothetical protein
MKPELKIDKIEPKKRKINIHQLIAEVKKHDDIIKSYDKFLHKKTKLVDKYDKISEIKIRFELLKSQKEVEYLKILSLVQDEDELLKHRQKHKENLKQIDDEFEFIKKLNLADEKTSEEDTKKLEEISSNKINIGKNRENILSLDDIKQLTNKKTALLKVSE